MLSGFMLPAKASASWLAGWSYRKKITISKTNVGADLSYFPLLVKISETGGASTNIGYNLGDKKSTGDRTKDGRDDSFQLRILAHIIEQVKRQQGKNDDGRKTLGHPPKIIVQILPHYGYFILKVIFFQWNHEATLCHHEF